MASLPFYGSFYSLRLSSQDLPFSCDLQSFPHPRHLSHTLPFSLFLSNLPHIIASPTHPSTNPSPLPWPPLLPQIPPVSHAPPNTRGYWKVKLSRVGFLRRGRFLQHLVVVFLPCQVLALPCSPLPLEVLSL